jgi:hypothetical protein
MASREETGVGTASPSPTVLNHGGLTDLPVPRLRPGRGDGPPEMLGRLGATRTAS